MLKPYFAETNGYDFMAFVGDEAFTDHIELTPNVVATVRTLEKLEKKEYEEDNVGFPIDIDTVRDAMKHPERNIIEPPQDVPRRRGTSL